MHYIRRKNWYDCNFVTQLNDDGNEVFVAANRRVMAHGLLADGVVLVRGAGARVAGRRRPALQLPHRAHARRYVYTVAHDGPSYTGRHNITIWLDIIELFWYAQDSMCSVRMESNKIKNILKF